MVLSAFPLVHPRGRLWRQPQLSCQRLYSLRLFFRRRGNFAAKNRPVRPRRRDLAMGGLVFPHFSDRLLPAYCVRGKPIPGTRFGLDSGCDFESVVAGRRLGRPGLDDAG